MPTLEHPIPKSIFLILDDLDDARAVQQGLAVLTSKTFVIEWARTLAEGMQRLSRQASEVESKLLAVVLDLELPDSHGIETFERLFALAPHTPFLVLSTSRFEATARLAITAGAQDYLLKSRLNDYTLPKALSSMIERAANAEALFQAKETAELTLNSMGDAVIRTDPSGRLTYLNAAAERLTGFTQLQADQKTLDLILPLIDGLSRVPLANPMMAAMAANEAIRLTTNALLLRADGSEAAIEDSAAPIHDRRGLTIGAVMVLRDVSGARAQSLKMTHQAQHDSLTDLPNRALLHERLTQAISTASSAGHPLALLFLDVDRFKHINDSLGHDMADQLLRSVAERLLACVRTTDTVSRQGGDEFVVLLPSVLGEADTTVFAERILEAISAPHRIGEREVHVTVSIGIVLYPDHGGDAETLLQNADGAMYRAKDQGRNNYQFFRLDMYAKAAERQLLESDLRHMLERREVVLHYQPIVDLKTHTIVAAEALIRWRHPRRGLVPPSQFIPVAEHSGQIKAIGRWVLREACRQARVWQDADLPAIRIAVNISAADLCARDFVGCVRATLEETGLAAHHLELELTETFLMQEAAATADVLHAFKQMGVHLALDDFGTGYSSLSYMRSFPIDTLKIDQSFVRDITTDASDAGIVNAVISMGKTLGRRVVAEGVETAEQLAFLKQHHCTEAQGHYFSEAIAAADFAVLLRLGRIEPKPTPDADALPREDSAPAQSYCSSVRPCTQILEKLR
ncbi:MAG: EAL domain-containing protein [Pseudomonadota bacterium]